MSASDLRIQVRDLDMRYGERVIQHDLSFSVRTGDIFVIMGGSGCGKSTLLRHLIGLVRPARGDVFYDGESFWTAEPDERDRMTRRFGVLYQSAALLLIVHLFEPFQKSILLPVLLEDYITLVLTALAGLIVGLAASAFAANEDSANSLLPFILIPQIVFAGVEIPLKNWPLQIIGMIFPTRWAVTALGSSAGLHSDKLGGDSLLGTNPTFHGTLFSTFTTTDATNRLLLAWGALAALIIVFTIVICIGLKRKDVRA